jgi:hypothetical protein
VGEGRVHLKQINIAAGADRELNSMSGEEVINDLVKQFTLKRLLYLHERCLNMKLCREIGKIVQQESL